MKKLKELSNEKMEGLFHQLQNDFEVFLNGYPSRTARWERFCEFVEEYFETFFHHLDYLNFKKKNLVLREQLVAMCALIEKTKEKLPNHFQARFDAIIGDIFFRLGEIDQMIDRYERALAEVKRFPVLECFKEKWERKYIAAKRTKTYDVF